MPIKTQPYFNCRGRLDLRFFFEQGEVAGKTYFAKITPSVLFGDGNIIKSVNAVHGSDRTLKPGEHEVLDLTNGSILDLHNNPIRFTKVIALAVQNNADPVKLPTAAVCMEYQGGIRPIESGGFSSHYAPLGQMPTDGKITFANLSEVDVDFSIVLAGWK
jgi:hypothetical protein